MIDLLSLQEKAEEAHKMLEDAGCPNRHVWDNGVWNGFTRAASPDVILSLCSELSAARERLAEFEVLAVRAKKLLATLGIDFLESERPAK